ncbi:Maf family nucleotide pyrophosphatase [Bradyrhizobium sp. LHD-71]|uniref:Maf family nucleotide pyrophosphatase n=1 Tax=Bradyrhizobium sp. LHD-71 TaxID=3072141 RepID=UPI0028101205|nr:Maf family nucleotide pyrophosphatase [Bradyrhizobium sp. LHD-71]MDQ8732647.1 Maf family nucleotide pyrophosphatase [Bradyrhizobium sp. LHD-71]
MTLWSDDRPLVLASQSKSRQALLKGAGIPFEAIPADIDERAIQLASELKDAAAIATLLAKSKALYVASRNAGRFVVGADQTLSLKDRLFNKPADRTQAADQIRSLAGKTHELHSAIALAKDERILFAHVAVARMTMRSFSEAMIDNYLDAAGDAVTTSVGAYQLEGLGVHLFERIEGDHFTILGLPLLPLLASLRDMGLVAE